MISEILRAKHSPWLLLTVLLLESVLAGWLLSDYNAPRLIWLGTQAIIIHLAWVGFDAVATAVAWSVAIAWIGAFTYAWPKSIPWAGIIPWAAALFMVWFLGLAIALTLAYARTDLNSIGLRKSQVFWFLVVLTWTGLGLGRLVGSGFLPVISH